VRRVIIESPYAGEVLKGVDHAPEYEQDGGMRPGTPDSPKGTLLVMGESPYEDTKRLQEAAQDLVDYVRSCGLAHGKLPVKGGTVKITLDEAMPES
jgi:hypothetical protein